MASSDHTASVAPKIVTVGAYKGGVGKTRTAYELAYLLQAPLIDFDYDGGGASGLWGYQHDRYVKAPLLDAFISERIPRPLSGGGKRPDLVPTHPNVGSELIHMDPEVVASRVEKWASEWGSEYVVIDTHPGYHPITLGALMAADLVIVPTTLDVNDLRGLAGMVRELVDYRMLIIPNRVPRILPRMGRKFLGEVMAEAGPEVRVGPFVNENRHLGQRTLLMAISAGETSARYATYIRQMVAIAATVRELVR
jgi:chromosome partitioning protein